MSISESMFSDNAAHCTLNIPNINSENCDGSYPIRKALFDL